MLICKPKPGSGQPRTVFSAVGTARADGVRTMRVGNEYTGPVEYVDEPFSDSVRPVWGRRERLADGAAGEL